MKMLKNEIKSTKCEQQNENVRRFICYCCSFVFFFRQSIVVVAFFLFCILFHALIHVSLLVWTVCATACVPQWCE